MGGNGTRGGGGGSGGLVVAAAAAVEEVQGHREGTGVVFGHCVGGRGGLGCRRLGS